jgi:hypothetical protein
MSKLHAQHPLRIFGFSIASSLAILLGVLFGVGPGALLVTLILVVVEITFSFDNAIINAKVLDKVSKGWQTVFLSAGIIVAIFGMRVLFPVVIVSLTAHLGWGNVVNLALHHPKEYAHHLELAHPAISAFGGAFLLMLALHFFFDDERKVRWINRLEKHLQKLSHWSGAPLVAAVVVTIIALLPANDHLRETFVAGGLGLATYAFIQLLVHALERSQSKGAKTVGKQVGIAAFTTLIYLEILDASFSFDGVIGAFAITSDVILIAAGLGIGALWVRSLTVFMVRRRTLGQFIYLEHGAHYTVLALALVLLIGIVVNISDFVPGIMGVVIIAASVAASVQERRRREAIQGWPGHF